MLRLASIKNPHDEMPRNSSKFGVRCAENVTAVRAKSARAGAGIRPKHALR
jgi:hypothetical protein